MMLYKFSFSFVKKAILLLIINQKGDFAEQCKAKTPKQGVIS